MDHASGLVFHRPPAASSRRALVYFCSAILTFRNSSSGTPAGPPIFPHAPWRSGPEATESARSGAALPASAKDGNQAVAVLEQALDADPNDAESHYQLGHVLIMLDRSTDAIKHYKQAVVIDPSRGDYHYQLGKTFHLRGQDENAVKAYQMAIERNPFDPAPYLSLGVSFEGLLRWKDAVGAYQRYLDLAPASPTTTALKWYVAAIMENQERARAGG